MSQSCRSLSVVVPLFQEESGVVHLKEGLARWRAVEEGRRRIDFVLVDDGSTDRTHEELRAHFAGWPVEILRHPRNLGLSAALRTGSSAARGELVAWLDSDLTYDPMVLSALAEQADGGADVACASCYHPEGQVVGVPRWRLWLSRLASQRYRALTGAPIWTFTCMVRVYRREVLARCPMTREGFVGVTEILLRAIRAGFRISESPATLRRRRTGVSKMRTWRVGRAHLALMRAWKKGSDPFF